MIVRDAPSPNFGPRREGKRVSLVVMHYTNTRSVEDSLALLTNPAREASAHYLVAEDGLVMRLVDEAHRAWHAGQSFWAGETDVNSISVGIEIQNPGHDFGYGPFPAPQMAAVTALCADIVARHAVDPRRIVAHSDVAPARKKDPGELFPWEQLSRDAGLGYWPAPVAEDHVAARVAMTDLSVRQEFLHRVGYDPRESLDSLSVAFLRHFRPETFVEAEGGVFDDVAAARLVCCARERPWG